MAVPKMSKEFWDDMDWVSQHYSELVTKYPDEWVAVVDGKVVSSGKDLGKVIEEAKGKTGKKQIVVEYVECGGHIYGAQN